MNILQRKRHFNFDDEEYFSPKVQKIIKYEKDHKNNKVVKQEEVSEESELECEDDNIDVDDNIKQETDEGSSSESEEYNSSDEVSNDEKYAKVQKKPQKVQNYNKKKKQEEISDESEEESHEDNNDEDDNIEQDIDEGSSFENEEQNSYDEESNDKKNTKSRTHKQTPYNRKNMALMYGEIRNKKESEKDCNDDSVDEDDNMDQENYEGSSSENEEQNSGNDRSDNSADIAMKQMVYRKLTRKIEDGYSSEENSDDEDDSEHRGSVTLDEQQNKVLNYVKKLMTDNQFRKTHPRIILLQGPTGTGKTEILKTLENEYNEVICTASTGVAALNFKGGRTAHSMFGYPFNVDNANSMCKFNDYNDQVKRASIIIYDAVNMTDVRLIEMLDKSLKVLMSTEQAFGGKIMIFGADFLELAPIVPGVLNPNSFSVKLSSIFDELSVKIFTLKKSFRNKKDMNYFNFIINLGSGNLPHNKQKDKFVPLNIFKFTTEIDELIHYVYPDEILDSSDLCSQRAILVPTIKNAIEINATITEIIDEEIVTCVSRDIINEHIIFEKYVEQMDKMHEDNVFPERKLKLWKGCVCMVLQNMYQSAPGYYETLLNGAKVIIEDIQSDLIWVRRPGCEKRIPIERKTFSGRFTCEKFTRIQFPLRLCYAMTIHKSQGQTLDKVGVDLREPVFCHGQLYLAMSRVRVSEDLQICVPEQQVSKKGVPYAKNIVGRRLVA